MTYRLLRYAPLALLAAAWLLSTHLVAQDAQAPAPTFRSRVDSVSVDAIVTDKQGRPVTDLTLQDFEILERGKLQTIETFKLIQTDDGRDDPSAARDILSEGDQRVAMDRADNRIFVIFLDDYHVRRSNSLAIRQRLAQFVSELTPHDLVAIALPLSPMSMLAFSRNHDATVSELLSFEGRKYDYNPKNAIEARLAQGSPEAQEQARNDLTIAGLRSLCQVLGALRDGRKTILMVSEGLSGTLPPGVRTLGTSVRPRVNPTDPTSAQESQQFFNSAGLINLFQVVFTEAARANTAIYTLDPRGLGLSEFGMEDDVTSAVGRKVLNETTDLLRTIAGETDGRAIVNKNDPMAELQQMVRDSATYYLLSYTTTVAPRDGRFHEIQVRVKRKEVEVRARKGYWAYSAEEIERANAPAKAGPPTEILNALDELSMGGEAGRTRAVSTWMGAIRGPAEKAQVTFAWEVPANALVNPSEVVDHVTISATSIYGDSLFNGPVKRDDPVGRAAGHVTFDAPAGDVRVRVVAETAKGFRLDSNDATLEVPDFTATGPQLSTPFVFRGRTARDIQQIRSASGPAPAVSRTFSRTERVLIRFDAYGPAGTVPTVTMRLLNSTGGAVASLLPPARTGSTFDSEISLGAFPPNDYLVEISAESNGQTIKKLVPLRVVG